MDNNRNGILDHPHNRDITRSSTMDQSLLTSPPRTPAARVRSVFAWLSGIACFGFLLSVIVLIAYQMIVPPPAPRVILLRNIPLPEGLKTKGAPDSLAWPPPNFLMALIF